MKHYNRMEVRCCCQPLKLLGWIKVHEEISKRQGPIIFAISTDDVRRHFTIKLEIREFWESEFPGDHKTYNAISAEGRSIEELIKIDGFFPNNEGHKCN